MARPDNTNTPLVHPNSFTAPRLVNVRSSNIMSSGELEVYIEKERILTVLNQTLYRLQLVVCLPMLLANNCELLRPLLNDKELALISKCKPARFSEIKQRDTIPRFQDSPNIKNSIKKPENVTTQPVNNHVTTKKLSIYSRSRVREDPGISKLVHMLCSKPRIQLHKLVISKNKSASPGSLNFLKNFCELRNIICARLNISPSALSCRERELRYAWRRNESAKSDICNLASKLELQKSHGYSLLDTRDELIHNQHIKLAKQGDNLKFDIKKIVDNSENRMLAQCNQKGSILESLSDQVKQNNSKFYSLLQDNLQTEKELRATRFKVESQLATWLDKYDQDIGEKQAEWDEINAGYEREINEMCILKEEFDIQEEEYKKLMAEKEEEYRRELEEKFFIFICNRAARRIQRYWRAYRERKLAKKKRHKGKKGKGSGGKGK